MVAWGQDLRRSIDFVATRSELDTSWIGYIGHSLGGRTAGVLLAIEPRIQASVLWVAGLSYLPTRREVDPVNYLPRVRMPVLMRNGRYDDTFCYADSQVPFFQLLGSPPDQKRHLAYHDESCPRARVSTRIRSPNQHRRHHRQMITGHRHRIG